VHPTLLYYVPLNKLNSLSARNILYVMFIGLKLDLKCLPD